MKIEDLVQSGHFVLYYFTRNQDNFQSGHSFAKVSIIWCKVEHSGVDSEIHPQNTVHIKIITKHNGVHYLKIFQARCTVEPQMSYDAIIAKNVVPELMW